MMNGDQKRPLSATVEEFAALCEFIYRRTGLSFPQNKRYFVERRTNERIAATGTGTFRAYFSLLRANAEGELEKLINSLTVNETYFFREEHQFRCLTSDLLNDIALQKRPGEPIRIWSAPCSTGEEPYSIAIWLLENWPHVDEYDIEIVGSDIDTQALHSARLGFYGKRALMRLTPALVERYFEQVDDDTWRISADLRESVHFSAVNLTDPEATRAEGKFDVIFCRNMLIYFGDTSRRAAVENFYDRLEPGGYICLGHSEAMSRISSLFRICRFEDAIVYQKPGDESDV